MSRFRLRYQATDLELPEGEFVIGRSSNCNLALDDALVSRRHAILRATADEVTVEDLGSRNGVVVNGVRVVGTRALVHLDRVTIGGQEIVLIETGRGRKHADTSDVSRCHVCGVWVPGTDIRCPGCGVAVVRGSATLAGQTLELKVPVHPGVADSEEVTRQATGFQLLAGIAHKALAMSRYDEAERILGKHLEGMLRRAEDGTLGRGAVAEATPYVLRLAEGLASGKWLDWVFRVHGAVTVVPSAEVVDALYEVVRKVGYSDPRALRACLTKLRPARQSLSAADKFVLSRLEGLERVIAA